jgi:hypothetical protein
MSYLSVWMFVLLIVGNASVSFAVTDLPILDSQRYERQKGAPTVYTETFDRCEPSDLAHLRVWNGESTESRITAAEIFVNGQEIFTENEFKQKDGYLEKAITVQKINELKVVLKSGDFKVPAFLRIDVLGKNCDNTPPVISRIVPGDEALLMTSMPLISADYADETDGSGLNLGTAKLIVDGQDVSSQTDIGAGGIRYTPRAGLVEGVHTVSLGVSDQADNISQISWSFTTDTIAPVVAISAPTDRLLTNVSQVDIGGTVNEAILAADVNGQSANVNGLSITRHAFPLAEGGNTLALAATDLAGNTGRAMVQVTLDSIPPSPPALDSLPTPTNQAHATV